MASTIKERGAEEGCAAEDYVCRGCNACGKNEIAALEADGHTYHCAARMVWGDGVCECKKQGIVPGNVSKLILECRF